MIICLGMNEAKPPTVTTPSGHPAESASRVRIRAAWGAVILIPVGFGTKYYSGSGAEWANNSFAGALYEVFWCLCVLSWLPRTSPPRIAAGVLIVTCGLEFLQLWHPAWLEALRATFLGRAILGSTFAWGDFPYYLIGCAMGWWLMRKMQGAQQASEG